MPPYLQYSFYDSLKWAFSIEIKVRIERVAQGKSSQNRTFN